MGTKSKSNKKLQLEMRIALLTMRIARATLEYVSIGKGRHKELDEEINEIEKEYSRIKS